MQDTTTMHPMDEEALQTIDAAFFSGDALHSPEILARVEMFLGRWTAEAARIHSAVFGAPAEFQRVEAPALDIDALLYKDHPMHGNAKLERRIVANLLAWLKFKGWNVSEIDDGEEDTKVSTAKEAMELIFDLDDVRIVISNSEGQSHRILLVLGNGIDIIADYSFTENDPDGFCAVMEGFNAEDYE